MPAALAVDWSAARADLALGLTFEQTAEKHGVSHWALRKRAQREHWVTPVDVSKALVSKLSKQAPKASKQATLDALQRTWAEEGESYRRMIVKKLVPLINTAQIDAPDNARDLETIDKVVRRNLGLDSGEGTTVNLVVAPQDWLSDAQVRFSDADSVAFNEDSPLYEADVVDTDADSDGD